jgi:hypothetical protein
VKLAARIALAVGPIAAAIAIFVGLALLAGGPT